MLHKRVVSATPLYYRYAFLIFLSLLVTLLVHHHFRYCPALDDGGTFAAVARQMSGGSILYKDVWDNKAPGIFFLNCLAIFISANPAMAPVILRFVFIFLMTLFIFRIYGTTALKWLSLLPFIFIFWWLVTDWGSFKSGNYTEFYGATFLLLPLAAISKSGSPRYLYLFSGLSISLSVLIKEPFIVHAAILLGFYSFRLRSDRKSLLMLLAGTAIPLLLFMLYVLLNIAFHDYLRYLKLAFDYSRTGHSGNTIIALKEYMKYWQGHAQFLPYFILPSLLSVFDLQYVKRMEFKPWILFVLCAGSFVFTGMGGIVYQHYFLPLNIFFALFCLGGIQWLIHDLPSHIPARKYSGFALTLILGWMLWRFFVPVKESIQKFTDTTYPLVKKSNEEILAFRKAIHPGETIYVEHEAMGRFYLYSPLTMKWKFPCPHFVFFGGEDPTQNQIANRISMERDFKNHPPDVVITRPRIGMVFQYTALNDFVLENYAVADSIQSCEGEILYVRRKNR